MLNRTTTASSNILSILKESKNPLSVSCIINKLKLRNLSPNKATIYRILKKLIDKKVIVELNIKNRFSFFEITKAEHHHFFCNECDKVFCLDNQNSKISLIQSLVENNNFSVESHEFNLYGTCQPCLERTNN